MDELCDLIRFYDNVLDPQVCQFLIGVFNKFTDKHERQDNEGKPNFTQFNLTKNRDLSEEINNVHNIMIKKTLEYRNIYYEFIDSRVFPEQHAFEEFRIKKYNPGGTDRFDTHVDVINHETSRRYLSFMWYLNDVDHGGNTVFKDVTIKPKTGSLLIFPPLWMYPHKGEPPISGEKYVISTYLHYK